MKNWKQDRIGSAERGDNPTVMVKMRSSYAVIGDFQFLPGYCVFLSNSKADSLNSLSIEGRSNYLIDMTIIGDAIIKVCNSLRINYSTLMNLDHYLHTHIEARYDWEPEEYKKGPSYFYPKEQKYDSQYEYNEKKYGELKKNLTEALKELMEEIY